MVVLSWTDLRQRRLPNALVCLVIGLYSLDAAVQHAPWTDVAKHILVGVVAFAAAAMMFRAGWMGGGDVKLAGAVFLWAGPGASWIVFCIVSFAGLILALVMLALPRVTSIARRSKRGSLQAFELARGVPYGVALCCGGFWAVIAPVAHLFYF
jgi:prepilin peptidase CpaA